MQVQLGAQVNARISGAAAWVRRQDWVLGAQLGCALVVTFHAEYTLALAAGVNEYVAYFVPGALDLYVIRALQKHRDVLLAVLVMVAANVASHLVSAGLVPVGWAVYSAVGGTVPLLLWRGHALRYTRTRKELLWGFPRWRRGTDVPAPGEYTGTGADAVKAPVPETVPVQVNEVEPVPVSVLPAAYHLDGCDGFCQGTGPAACIARAAMFAAWDEEYAVPEDRTRRRTDTPAEVRDEYGVPDDRGGVPDHVPEWVQAGEAYPPLMAVPDPPDVPAEYAPGAVHSPVLVASDWSYLAKAEEYVRGCKDVGRKPSVRGMRSALKIGQDRAERLLEHLGVEP